MTSYKQSRELLWMQPYKERCSWLIYMLAALKLGVKVMKTHFAEMGLFSLKQARRLAGQSR